MPQRTVNILLLVAGVLLILVAAIADSLGIGSSPGLGALQIAGMIVGVVLAAVGLVRLRAERT